MQHGTMQRGRETSTPVRSQAIGREPSGPRAAETRLDPDKAQGPRGTEGVQHDTATRMRPRTPLERRGSSCSAGCTKNQPRRPIIRPFRGTKKFRSDCLQVPRLDVHALPNTRSRPRNLVAIMLRSKNCNLSFVIFLSFSGQTGPETQLQRARLEKWCRTCLKLAPETNYNVTSWPCPGPGPKKLNFK
jgi:hypothetical protein